MRRVRPRSITGPDVGERGTRPQGPAGPFADLPPTPAAHFGLCFYAAILRLLEHTARACGSREAAIAHFPFLGGYWEELAARGLGERAGTEAEVWWAGALGAWEAGVATHLPLRALREPAGLDYPALLLLLTVGLVEEDARFGALFESLQGLPGQGRPTAGLAAAWWPDTAGGARAVLRHLQTLGLIHPLNPDAPRADWAYQPVAPIWDALQGDAPAALPTWARYRAPADLAAWSDLILPEAVRPVVEAAPGLLASGEVGTLIVRGPSHNGRRTTVGAVARALGRGVLEVDGSGATAGAAGAEGPAADRLRLAGPLATVLHAVPVLTLDLGPGETAEVPALTGYDGPLGIVLGPQGGLGGPGAERALTVTLPLPDPDARRRHWRASGQPLDQGVLDPISARFRLTSGNIHRAAGLAAAHAALDGRAGITPADVQAAGRSLGRQALDTLAAPVPATGSWSDLAVGEETLCELLTLESRCRHRERLAGAVGGVAGAGLAPGVRALFSGPSGTGKSLAARLLAAALGMDLYRLDLAAVVNKYIGETEKNLNRVFARAEELDVILLLDEGDALLTQRTGVHNANDRYANLETNYLLQRLEAFEGILLVTTNAGGRIDDAFARRMDVVVTFHPPAAAERWAIWHSHLPPEHAVGAALLDEVARRCALSGGQIRNAALHAALLALDDGGVVTGMHLEGAVQREYRKAGAVCPLRATVVSRESGVVSRKSGVA